MNKDLSDRLDGIIKRLLAKDPRERYQTANEVLLSLNAVPAAAEPAVAELAARIRRHHDVAEAQLLDQVRLENSGRDTLARNTYKEQELLALIDEVVAEINAHLAETKIQTSIGYAGKEYRFGNRTLHVVFFPAGELYRDPEVPGRMDVLKKRHVVHGGYIEIREGKEDREGWNVVLVRPPESTYGEWRIVETRVSPLTGKITRYVPIATEARLFADNLACHWSPAVHVYTLTDKTLEKSDIFKILNVFIPKT